MTSIKHFLRLAQITIMSLNSNCVPFPSSCALNKDRLSPPFDPNSQHLPPCSNQKAYYVNYLPGQPTIRLDPDEVINYLVDELDTILLDELYDNLWLVGKQSGQHVDALHIHRVKGRTIVPAEAARLHLIWDHNNVYIKPIPVFLLNYDVWARYLSSAAGASKHSTAVGFLRSYAHLILHPLDLAIAQELHLIPPDISWLQWATFISYFRHIGDEHVAKRYHYGQLRLSRLNWIVRISQPKYAHNAWYYELPHWSINDFVVKYTVSLVFIFVTISLALSAMQVALSVPSDALWFEASGDGLKKMGCVFWVFAIIVLLLWVMISLLLVGIPFIVLAWQLSWGYRNQNGHKAIS